MLSEEQVRKVALFFLFALSDEKVALEAAHKAVSRAKSAAVDGRAGDVDLIRAVYRVFDQFKTHRSRGPIEVTGALLIPEGVELSIWRKFQKDGGPAEVVALILSRLLGFDDEAIAKGLNISVGTVRYRVGKGVRGLGLFARKTPTDNKAGTRKNGEG